MLDLSTSLDVWIVLLIHLRKSLVKVFLKGVNQISVNGSAGFKLQINFSYFFLCKKKKTTQL